MIIRSLGTSHPAKGYARWLQLLLLPVLLLALVGAMPASAAVVRVQPQLLALAAAQPDAPLSVIVQKSSTDLHAEQRVVELGGAITQDLHIINAFAATMSGKSVLALAADPAVRWISLNATVESSSILQADDKATPTPTPVPTKSPDDLSNSANTTNTTRQFTTWSRGVDVPSDARTSLNATFNSSSIPVGSYLWFSAVVQVSYSGSSKVQINFEDSTITFNTRDASYKLRTPDGALNLDPATANATSSFDNRNTAWVTQIKNGTTGDLFLTGFGMRVPETLPGNISSLTWNGWFATDTPGVRVSWKWSAAVYSGFSDDFNALGVKPIARSSGSSYANGDPAGTPESFKTNLIAGARGTGGANYVGSYTSGAYAYPVTVFSNFLSITNATFGLDGQYAAASNRSMGFTRFVASRQPGYAISKVELVLRGYASRTLQWNEDLKVTASCDGYTWMTWPVTLDNSAFNNFVGSTRAGSIYLDITNSRSWKWSDFDSCLKIKVDQGALSSGSTIYYDGIGLRITSVPGNDNSGGRMAWGQRWAAPILPAVVKNTYQRVTRVTNLWNEAPLYPQGGGVTVAVIDSGIASTIDLDDRVIANVNLNPAYSDASDKFGHGTFVAGVIAGNGTASQGKYTGVAPQTNLVNVRVSDDRGMATEADVVAGMQWVLDNRDIYNIKVVNISLNSSSYQTYNTSPMDAAAEILWFNKITVVVAAGNNGTANLYPPANDPFVITVGASDDKGTDTTGDDTIPAWSAYGFGEGNSTKPDLVAPGANIIALMPKAGGAKMGDDHPANRVDDNYFRMSGTSVAAPVVAGAVALLLQREPTLTPDQIKFRLKTTANKSWSGYSYFRGGAGQLDVYAAAHAGTTGSANTGIPASRLLWSGGNPITWGSVNWNSVNWNSVNWNSVNWNSVNWNSVNWNSDYWGVGAKSTTGQK